MLNILNKFELIKPIMQAEGPLNSSDRPKLLDVGCRGCELMPYVNDICSYEGADLFQNDKGTVTHVLDVSEGLPFDDNSFDFVVALDLVEHLDDFKAALEDLVRVSKTTIIMLPNLAHAAFRWKFLRTGTICGKYDLRYGQGQDRHRWLTVLDQCDEYMEDFAQDHKLNLSSHWFYDSNKKKRFAQICRLFGIKPQFWIWSSYYVLTKSV